MAPAGIFVNRFFGAVKPIQMDKTTHKIPTKKIVMKSLNSWGETKMDVHQDPPQWKTRGKKQPTIWMFPKIGKHPKMDGL